jgi:hypothetical protein
MEQEYIFFTLVILFSHITLNEVFLFERNHS